MKEIAVDDYIRICLVALKFSPSIGGTQARIEKQARQLRILGYHVTVITLRLDKLWKKEEMFGDFPVIRVGGIYAGNGLLRLGRIGILPACLSLLLKLWQMRRDYDVIHIFEVSPLAAAAALVSKLTKKPVIISIQNTGPDKMQRMQLEREAVLMKGSLGNENFLTISYENWAVGNILYLHKSALGGSLMVNFLRKSDAIYQILSTRSKLFLVSQGFRSDHIVHISGSVDANCFRPSPQNRSQLALERIIICVARLEYPKGIDVLLHTWQRLLSLFAGGSDPLKPRLRLVGDGALRHQLEQMAVGLGIQESVEFLGPRTDVIELLQQSWGFVLPSRWEGMPNALLEAMACGLPCVATRVSGSEDIIQDGINGLLVEPTHVEEMALALYRILTDCNLAQRLADKGRATVVHNYQLSSVVEQCLELYQRARKREIPFNR